MNEEVRFRAAIDISWHPVFVVGEFYHSLGDRWGLGSSRRIRPSFEQRNGYGDAADLMVSVPGTDKWDHLEVKRRLLEFHDHRDFPFPTIFVDRREKVDRHHADKYITVNRELAAMAVIDWASTFESWIVKTHHDQTKGYPVTVYECPLELVQFVPLK